MVKVAIVPFAVVTAIKDAVQDSSVMLQMRQSDALLAASASSSPDQLSALLQKQATDMVSSGGESPYTDDGTLDGIKGTMTELIQELKDDIADGQTKINGAKDNVVDHFNTIKDMLQATTRTRDAHYDCRQDEDQALEEEIQECTVDLMAYWTAPVMPTCDASKIEDIMGTRVWEEGWGAKLDDHVTVCKAKQKAADVYTDAPKKCNTKQDDFEDKWCKSQYAHVTNCANIRAQERDYSDAVTAFVKHSHMIASARKVQCFIDVIQLGGTGTQLDGNKVQACVDLKYFQSPEKEETVEATVSAAVLAKKITVTYDPLPGSTDGDSISLDLPNPDKKCKDTWERAVRGSEGWKKSVFYSHKADKTPIRQRIQARYTETVACPTSGAGADPNPMAIIPYADMTASQSSRGWDSIPGRCLTANPQPAYPGTCSHTLDKIESGDWWKVSLSGVYEIESVTITNRDSRGRGWEHRLDTVDIYVGGHKCGETGEIGDGQTKTIPCVGTGSEIMLKQRIQEWVTICGFQAKGRKIA